MSATLAVRVDVLLDECELSGLVFTSSCTEGILVRNYEHDGVRALVVVKNDIVNVLGNHCEVVLIAFRRVLFTVGRDKQGLEASGHVEVIRVFLADVAAVTCVEPSVNHSLCRSLRVLPVTCHHVLTLDYDFSGLAVRQNLAFVIADDALHRPYDTAG